MSDDFGSRNVDFKKLQGGNKMTEKIVQTAGRDALGNFAPNFAHYNDDILFGDNWKQRGH